MKECWHVMYSNNVARWTLFLIDSMKVKWFLWMCVHITKSNNGPPGLYFGSIQLCNITAKSVVKEFMKNNASNIELKVSVPCVCCRVNEFGTSRKSIAFCWIVFCCTWEKFRIKSMDWLSRMMNIAAYKISFCRQIWIVFNIEISSSGEQSYLGGQACTCYLFKLSFIKYIWYFWSTPVGYGRPLSWSIFITRVTKTCNSSSSRSLKLSCFDWWWSKEASPLSWCPGVMALLFSVCVAIFILML